VNVVLQDLLQAIPRGQMHVDFVNQDNTKIRHAKLIALRVQNVKYARETVIHAEQNVEKEHFQLMEKCANVQNLVNLLMIHVHQDLVMHLKRLSLVHKHQPIVQQSQNVVRKVQLLMMLVEK